MARYEHHFVVVAVVEDGVASFIVDDDKLMELFPDGGIWDSYRNEWLTGRNTELGQVDWEANVQLCERLEDK